MFLRLLLLVVALSSCTQEFQNQVSRDVQNWTGANGVLDIVSAGKVMYRFIEVDKVSTARGSGKSATAQSRPYRFGWGVLDRNMNYRKDPGEKKLYFEISDYSTTYIMYENPNL